MGKLLKAKIGCSKPPRCCISHTSKLLLMWDVGPSALLTLHATCTLGMGRAPPSPQPELVTKCQKHDFSNLYKELGYDSTHNFDIIARSLYSLGARKAISKITTLIGKP